MSEQKKSGGTKWILILGIIGLLGGNYYWNSVDPVPHQDHSGEHWSVFKQFLPEATFQNLENALGPTWIFDEAELYVSHVFMAILVLLIGLGLALSANRRYKAATDEERLLPPKTWSALAVFDVITGALLGLMETLMPREMALRALPLMTAFAVFIFISNFMGLVPGFLPPTDNLNTTMAIALVAFLYYNYWGIRKQGLGPYLAHLCGPSIWLAPLMLPVEIISHIARPASLAIRLMGNMFGDHLVLSIFLSFHLILVPLPLIALGLIVVTVQTAVFTLLAIVYVALAVEVHEHDHDHGHGEHAHA